MRGTATLAAASLAAGLAGRYMAGNRSADRHELGGLERSLEDLGAVDRLSIMPIVERHTSRPTLTGEPGVSYLIRADDLTLLFDCGLGSGRAEQTPLEANARSLGLEWSSLDCLVLSHLHADHVGGPRSQLRRTFSLGEDQPTPGSLPVYVPTEMTHSRADVCLVTEPRVVGRGVAVLPPLPRMLFWLGSVAEQAVVVNVRGRGLVLVTGCGHPEIERMLSLAEQVVDMPVCAVVGGLHLPVHPLGTPLLPQAVLGNPHWPWHPIDERDVERVLDHIRLRAPDVVALSGHDSTPWTIDAFGRAFGDRYRTLRVGEELVISGGSAG